MTRLLASFLALILACPGPARAEDEPKIDVVAQRVLRQNGVDSKILRAYDEIKDKSPRSDGRFFFNFDGAPGFQVFLDRDYWVLVTQGAKKDNDVIAYMLNPRDEQSALNISMGNDLHDKTDEDLKKEPGFFGITTASGTVDGQKVRWRRWSDQEHLHSDCTLLLPARDKGDPATHKVSIVITANTKERRNALEQSLKTFKPQYSKE